MTIKYANLCSVILKQFFGENVQLVADALFASVSRSIPTLTKTTNLPRNEVCMALAILIKFRLAKYEPSLVNESLAEYSINREEVLYIIRYPKYVQLMQAKYGDIAADITEEILRSGTQTCCSILLKCFASRENKGTLQSYRDEFFKMIEAGYLKRIPVPKKESEDPVPTLQLQETEIFQTPEIDLQQLTLIHSGRKIESKDSGVYWQVNFQRFHQDLRDTIMILAIEKKLGANAADCFRFLLVQMYERTDPWQQEYSNPFTFVEIKQAVEKKSNNMELVKYLDQFVSLIADDSINFIRKIGDTGGGQYIVELKKGFEELALCCTEHIITEKFGSKASRIFRVIKAKKYIEQEDIQKEAMVPAKEAKLLTYKLFEEQFIQIKTIRKAGGGGSGPAKAFYLFHVNNTQVVKMLLDICYKAFYNSITRSNFEKHTNKRLIEKSQKLENIVETIKERGQSDEYIAEIMETLTPPEREILDKVKTRIKTLSNAELAIDDTIFLLQMYLYYHSTNRK